MIKIMKQNKGIILLVIWWLSLVAAVVEESLNGTQHRGDWIIIAILGVFLAAFILLRSPEARDVVWKFTKNHILTDKHASNDPLRWNGKITYPDDRRASPR